jgi:hypothetical protein
LGTIERLDPTIPQFVLSSYSVDGGPAAIYNATEQAQFQFQQNFFQSGSLVPGSHTLVVTHLNNNARLFIDYFLIIPPDSTTTLAPTSTLPTSATSSSTSAVITAPGGVQSHSGITTVSAPTSMLPTSATSSSTSAAITALSAGNGVKSHSGTTPTAAIIGGSLGALALIGIAALVFWFIRKRVKNDYQRRKQNFQSDTRERTLNKSLLAPQSFPNLAFNSVSTTKQYPSPGGSHVSQFSYPTPSTPSQGIIPPSKAVQDAQYPPVQPFPLDNSLNSRTLPEPPRYEP